MRYNVQINQQKCIKYGLTVSEAALMDLFNQLSSWAEDEVIDGKNYYHLSRNKVVTELPFFFNKPDTVYRAFRKLDQLNLIEFEKIHRRDFIRLSANGKKWNKLGNKSESVSNSEMNPSKLGNISENENSKQTPVNTTNLVSNSEMNPTYNNNTTNDKRETRAHEFLKSNYPSRWSVFEMRNKKQIDNYEKFLRDFDSTADIEELNFKDRVLFGRIDKFASNWIANTKTGKVVRLNHQNELAESHPSRKKISY